MEIQDVIKSIRDNAALASAGLTGYRKHLVRWADDLEKIQEQSVALRILFERPDPWVIPSEGRTIN